MQQTLNNNNYYYFILFYSILFLFTSWLNSRMYRKCPTDVTWQMRRQLVLPVISCYLDVCRWTGQSGMVM